MPSCVRAGIRKCARFRTLSTEGLILQLKNINKVSVGDGSHFIETAEFIIKADGSLAQIGTTETGNVSHLSTPPTTSGPTIDPA